MENKNKTLLTSPDSLKKLDEVNRLLYKQLISKVSKVLITKPLYAWKIKSNGLTELFNEYDMNWPMGQENKVGGFICLDKSFVNVLIHYLLGGSEKKYNSVEHKQLTTTDINILKTFFTPIIDSFKELLKLPSDVQIQQWIDDKQLLPFIPPGQNFYAFELEVQFDQEVFPIIFLSQYFEVKE